MKTLCLLLFPALLSAQILTAPRTVQASGSATVTVQPDQALFTVSVVTQANTAQDAAAQNATLATAVTQKIASLLGNRGSLKTVGYSIQPRYSYPAGQPAQLVGYTATNTVQVTCNDLTIIGSVIDGANQAGANSVSGLQFTLQNPEPVRLQALQAAAKMARTHADAIATGLGLRTGNVLNASEGSSISPIIVGGVGAGASTTTPITTGTLDVTATVAIVVELQQ